MNKMPDLPTKKGRKLADHRTPSERDRDEWIANRNKPSTPSAKPVVRKSHTSPKATWEKRKAVAEQKVKRVQKSSMKKAGASPKGYQESEHPRDRAGRFAVKAVKATVKGVGKVARGTAKVVKGTHRVVKRAYANARRDDALAYRRHKLDLHKQEVAAGLRRTRTTRRKKATPAKRKGGFLGLFGGSKKGRRR